jgi:hypothetical protein
MHKSLFVFLFTLAVLPLAAQPQPAKPASDDTPSIKVGALLFADYTYTASPDARDADGNAIHPNAFNIGRVYLNVSGNINHRIAFRITPEVTRETGSGSTLNGSYVTRLKFAYAQFNLDDWLTKGSYLRVGLNDTPFIIYEEGVYRYRFQGPIMVDREGYLFASDAGIGLHYNLPGNYGDIQTGVYNGEGWAHAEANDQKALQLRATVRPMPLASIVKGLRLTGFYDEDHYVKNGDRKRAIAQVTFEHPRVNAGLDLLSAKDRRSVLQPEVASRGYSAWVTPKLTNGWELLLRRDELRPDRRSSAKKTRDIEGLAYWFPMQPKTAVTTALMLDRDSVRGIAPVTNWGLKLLVSF